MDVFLFTAKITPSITILQRNRFEEVFDKQLRGNRKTCGISHNLNDKDFHFEKTIFKIIYSSFTS